MARSKMSVYVKSAAVQANAAAVQAKKEKVTLPDIILGGPEMTIAQPSSGKIKKGTKTNQEIALIDETREIKPKQPVLPKSDDALVPDSTSQTKLEEESYWQAPVADNENEIDDANMQQAAQQIQTQGMNANAAQTQIAPTNAPQAASASQAPMLSSSLEPLRVLEAALFMSSQSMQAVDLGKLVGIGAVGHVSTLLGQLSKQYDQSGSSLEVVEENAGKWVMRIRASFAPSVRRFAGEAEIPKHALRTLAYISRHEGITKRDLFRRLGGSIYEDVADLVDKGFLQTNPVGRTHALNTTTKFKQYFQG